MKYNVREAIKALENMLKWSDRIGSDEIAEIEIIIQMLKN